jgi:arginine utilization protein RocB
LKEKELLQKEIIKLKDQLRETENRAEKWLELTEKTFTFATYAERDFLTGDLQKKKEVMMGLGSNPTILNGKLTIQAHEWLVPIQNDYPALEKKYKRLELDKMPMNATKKEALASIRQS